MTEAVREQPRSAFQLPKDVFYGFPILMVFMLESGAEPMKRGRELGRSVDEEQRIVDRMFFQVPGEEHPSGEGCSRWKQPNMEQPITLRVDVGEEPEPVEPPLAA